MGKAGRITLKTVAALRWQLHNARYDGRALTCTKKVTDCPKQP